MTSPIPFEDFGGSGPVLHFAHPNAYPPGCFRQFLAPFTADYRVLAVHHRPLWPGSRPEEMTDWRLVTDDLIRFFDQQGLRGVVGVGHSLGAVATMYAAVQRPDLFHTLVLIDPVFLPPALLAAAAANPEAATFSPMVTGALKRRRRWPSRQAAFDRFRRKSVFRRWSDEALWDYVNYGTAVQPNGEVALAYPPAWEARFYAMPPQQVWAALPQLIHPTLAVRAADSDTLFPEAWSRWQAAQPAATFVEVAGVGHMLTMERPLAVAQLVLDYLRQPLPPGRVSSR